MGVVHSKSRQQVWSGSTDRKPKSPIDIARGPEIDWSRVDNLFAAARSIVNPAFVYFIGEEDGPLKIGTATNPVKRLRSMQTGNPRRLKIENVILGDRQIESLLHDMWEDFAIRSPYSKGKQFDRPGTEWFKPEIRTAGLLEIADTAAEYQVDFITAQPQALTMDDMEVLVREAHGKHDFVAKGRDEVRLLATSTGYVSTGRRSRI
jgi:hypothetical protein